MSFVAQMRAKAKDLGVDLLLVDTGDLHDGAGLSDTTSPDGEISNVVFQKMDYDLLTIGKTTSGLPDLGSPSGESGTRPAHERDTDGHDVGNHELYLADVAYQDYNSFSKAWGDKYLTSNVQILDQTTNEFTYLGNQYRYFTTDNGIRILAFGVLFDFTGNTNVTKVIPASTMVNETWFQSLLATPPGPVDLFLLIGHNTVLKQKSTGTFGYLTDAIRATYPSTPIQIFGGHSHIRDFRVYDSATTALESGRYCETLGWLAMSGFNASNSNYTGASTPPAGVSAPARKATTDNTSDGAPWTYARRYLDWNRLTFEYHASGSQTNSTTTAAGFDTAAGQNTTALLYGYRQQLSITARLGCSPQLWCQSCAEFNSSGSIYNLLSQALGGAVVSPARADKARVSILNTGSVRFDLHKGPFLVDDTYIVSPFVNIFVYIPDVPYSIASGALD